MIIKDKLIMAPKIAHKEHIENELAIAAPITKEIEHIIYENTIIITGSFCFGGFEAYKSDIDLLMKPTTMGQMFPNIDISEYFVYVKEYFEKIDASKWIAVYYCKLQNGQVLNLIFVKEKEKRIAWKKATYLMKQIAQLKSFQKYLNNKNFRINLFTLIRETIENE